MGLPGLEEEGAGRAAVAERGGGGYGSRRARREGAAGRVQKSCRGWVLGVAGRRGGEGHATGEGGMREGG